MTLKTITYDALLRCPFTGEQPKFRLAKKRYCQLHGDPLHQDTIVYSSAVSFQAATREGAINLWNTRAPQPPSVEDIEDDWASPPDMGAQ